MAEESTAEESSTPGWRGMVESARGRVEGLPARTRLVLIGVGAALVAAVGLGIWVSGESAMEVLFSELSSDDSARIIEQLGGLQVPYELQEEGSTILVPGDRVHDTRLTLAAAGLPSGGDSGFELFDEQRFGESEFSERVKYHRALEGELARTISHLSGVERARVHLVLPSRSLFVARDESASASVVLHLRPGRRLSEEQAAGILHLVASSVRGMSTESVTLVDGEGRPLGGAQTDGENAGDALEYRRQVERERERAAQELLDATVGPGTAMVRVSADVSFTREEQTEERFLPDEVAARSVQLQEERNSTATATAAGIPGAASNLPGGEAATTQQNDSGLVRRSETRNFEISKTTARRVVPVGRIERLQVAVVVDGVWTGEGEGREFTARDEEEMQRLEAIVARAVGVVADRGDEITVSCIPFATQGEMPTAVADPVDQLMGPYAPWRPYAEKGLLGLVGVITLLVLLRRRRKKKKAKAEADEKIRAELVAGKDGAEARTGMGALPSGEKVALSSLPSAEQLRAEIQEPDETIPLLAAELASDDPARAARVVRGWLMQGERSETNEEDDGRSTDHAA